MEIISIYPPVRTQDKHGTGEFGAPRGARQHNGVDIVCPVGSVVCSPVEGVVSKLGYPYGSGIGGASGSSQPYRYVQVTDSNQQMHRVFYIEPTVEMGSDIREGDPIGKAQDLGERYEDITPHVHYEIKLDDGSYINPEV